MLTRMKVSGFKNLMDIDVAFGPFTCIAGSNGAGKSNLFDAIMFLSATADKSLVEAARSIRGGKEKNTDIQGLFHRSFPADQRRLAFEVEMIVPPSGEDDLGQRAEASITFLRYILHLNHRPKVDSPGPGELQIVKEELSHLKLKEAKKNLPFPHSTRWRKSAVKGRRTSPFISTEEDPEHHSTVIKIHQERTSGRSRTVLAANTPRTVLSSTTAETPTALLARRELQSWRLLHLEPSAMREPDTFQALDRLEVNGAHLPATLYRLAHRPADQKSHDPEKVYANVANRIAELIEDVDHVFVDKDEKNELLTLFVKDRRGIDHEARSLSDGTLRFLALTVLEHDPQHFGLICLEEPENGIHPERIPAMIRLLYDLAVDSQEAIDRDNPLRQVIINTHSPSVVRMVKEGDMLIARAVESKHKGQRIFSATLSWFPETWRCPVWPHRKPFSLGQLLSILNPPMSNEDEVKTPAPTTARRIKDHPDLKQQLPLPLLADK